MDGYTIAEKILMSHRVEGDEPLRPGQIVRARVDRVLLNDVSGPLAFQQFERMGPSRLDDVERVVLVADHFAPPPSVVAAHGLHQMRQFSERYGIEHFYDIGTGGIEHSLLPEKHLVTPGDLIIGGDSHTCTYGAFNAFGTGLGSTDIAAAMALGELWFRVPQSLRLEFTGLRRPYVTGKDFILRVISEIGVDGATYMAMEFSGEAIRDLNMDERMAVCNMAVEAGAKSGIVVPDQVLSDWAQDHGIENTWGVDPDPLACYQSTYHFDMGEVGPLVAVPHSPATVKAIAEVAGRHVDQVYIGNCANGTLTDLRQTASILKEHRVARQTRLIVVPATQQIYHQALKEGLIDVFIEAGAAVSTPSCGACFGGHSGLLDAGEVAVATTNRNFRGRMGHSAAEIYLANAYVAASCAVAGELIDPALVVSVPKGGDLG